MEEMFQSDEPGLWLKNITDRDREAVVRSLATRDGDVQTPQDSEGNHSQNSCSTVRQPVGGEM